MITGYIPSDKNKVYMQIYCLIQTKNGFYWINCVNNSMIGGSTDNPEYESSEEALIRIHGFTHEIWRFVHSNDFVEVIDCYNNIKDELNLKLNNHK